jgi:hypothetical protein
MRTASLALLAALLLFVPLAGAHTGEGSGQRHLEVRPVQLGPGEHRDYLIESEEGPWQAGMVFLLYVQFHNGTRDVLAELVHATGEVVLSWNLTAERRHHVTGRIPYDAAHYELRMTNIADNRTQFFFYFDQNCNCTFKPVPLQDGWVLLSYDLRRGRDYYIGFPLAAGWTVEAALATRTHDASIYPQAFDELQRKQETGPGWLEFNVQPADDARHYVFIWAREGSPPLPDPQRFVSITPLLEDRTPKDSPGAALAAVLAALGIAVAVRRRA